MKIKTPASRSHDGGQVIAEYEGVTLVRKFIYGPGIDEPIIMIDVAGSNTYWYHYDGLGSVVALSNNSGTIVEGYIYDVFGTCTVITSAGTDGNWLTDDGTWDTKSAYDNPYQFTGRRWDDETGLYYYRARYYKPEIGRFLQPDPIGYADSMNLYQYCLNNPANWVDPWGLETKNQRSPEEELELMKDFLEERNLNWWKHPGKYYVPLFWGECCEQAVFDSSALQDFFRENGIQYWRVAPTESGARIRYRYFLSNHNVIRIDPVHTLRGYEPMILDSFTIPTFGIIPTALGVFKVPGFGWFGPHVEVMPLSDFNERWPLEAAKDY